MKTRFSILVWLISGALLLVACGHQRTQTSAGAEGLAQDGITLVTGITGNQGGGVANTLLNEGFKVRGMTRNPDSENAQYWADRGAEIVYGDFTDRESIDSVLVGVDYIFINLQEQVPDYVNATKYLLDAANAAGVKHILYSSSRSSEPGLPQSGHKTEIEVYLREAGYSYTTLRIPQQMSSVLRDLSDLLTIGWRGRSSEERTFAWISPDDLGPIAAAAISDPEGWNGREVNLSGDELTDLELVSIYRELSGLDIKYTPPAEADGRWTSAQALTYDTEWLHSEFPMTTFREYLIENDFGENLRAMSVSLEAQGLTLTGVGFGPGGTSLPGSAICPVALTPEFVWQNAPQDTESFVITLHAPIYSEEEIAAGAEQRPFRYWWMVYNIPGSASAIEAGGTAGGIMGTNIARGEPAVGYSPPCPQGGGTDIPVAFTLFALSDELDLPEPINVTWDVLTAAMEEVLLESTTLRVTFDRVLPETEE